MIPAKSADSGALNAGFPSIALTIVRALRYLKDFGSPAVARLVALRLPALLRDWGTQRSSLHFYFFGDS
jgi:hypothetical protein